MPAVMAGSFWVQGVDAARSVVVLPDGRPELAASCSDDGAEGDAIPGDGVWRCRGPEHSAEDFRVILDGQTLVIVRGPAPSGPYGLEISGKQGQLRRTDAPRGQSGVPRPATPSFLLEIDRGPIKHAPVVDLVSGGSKTQATCRDDGSFPDRAQNDSVAACTGVAPGQILEVRVRSGWEEQVFNLNFPPETALMQARLDENGLVADRWVMGAEAEPLAPSGTPPPPPEPMEQGPQAPPTPSPPSGGHSPPSGGGADPGLGWSIGLAVFTGVFAFALGRRKRRGALPSALSWAQAPEAPLIERAACEPHPDRLNALLLQRSRRGLVVVLSARADLPAGEPGPVLRATSDDALDLAEALCALRQEDPLRQITVMIEDETLLKSPGELALTPLERLCSLSPPGVVLLVLQSQAA